MKETGGECKRRTPYAIRNVGAHTGNQRDATAVAESDHLLGGGLGGHEHARDVDLEHRVGVFGRVFEGGSLLLDAGGGDEAIELVVGAADLFDDVVQLGHVANVNLTVVEGGVELGGGAVLDAEEVGGGFGETVESVNLGQGNSV